MNINTLFRLCLLSVCLVLNASIQGWVPEYEAVSGEVGLLPCNVSIPNESDVISLILWYRDADRAPIYTLDFRRGPPDKAKHFPSQPLGDRAYFEVSLKPPMLKLDPVQSTDEGLYRCSIEYRRSRTVTSSVKLKILVPPRSVIIMDDRGQKLKGLAGPYDEGAYLSLLCEAEGGDPSPAVTWWRSRSLLDDTYFRSSQGFVRNELVILELRRSDLMVELTCQATNTNLSRPINDSVRIDLNLKPTRVTITTKQKSLKVGEDLRLDCETSGSRPPAKTTWWMENNRIQSGKESIPASRNLTYSSLFLKAKQDDNGRTIICKADNPALPHSGMEDSWYLNVLYPPEVSLTLGANIKFSTIREGNDVYLECIIKANPPVSELTWLFESQPFYSNASVGIIISNQSLVLQRVRKEHRGRYTCIASNTEGTGQSLDLMLEVRYAPTCKLSQKSLYGVARGEVVNISCEVEADPTEVTFRWALNNSVENLELQSYSSRGEQSILSFIPRNMLEYGALLCWGRNSVGEQKEPCVVRVIPAGPPDPVRDCAVINSTDIWLLVQCEPGYNGGLDQRFHLDVYNSAVEHLEVNLTSFEAPLFSVSDLPTGTSFLLVVYATNEKGKSNSVALMGNTLNSSQADTEAALLGTLSPLVALLLAVVGTLLIIGVAALAFLQIRKRPRKAVPHDENKFKSSDLLKKTAEDLVENSAACPDVVPPNNIYGCRDSDSVSSSKKEFQSPDNAKTKEDMQSCANALQTQWSLKRSHQEKADVEVTLPDLNQPSATVSRLLPSPSDTRAAQTSQQTSQQLWPTPENDAEKCVLVVEVQPNGTGHRTKAEDTGHGITIMREVYERMKYYTDTQDFHQYGILKAFNDAFETEKYFQ